MGRIAVLVLRGLGWLALLYCVLVTGISIGTTATDAGVSVDTVNILTLLVGVLAWGLFTAAASAVARRLPEE